METGSTSVADNVPYGLYGKIVRTAEVVRGGIKGLLVWDAIIFNEITFQEAITHKKLLCILAGMIKKQKRYLIAQLSNIDVTLKSKQLTRTVLITKEC